MATDRPLQFARPCALAVEGRDAEEFWKAATEAAALTDVQVFDFGGNEQLGRWLKAAQVATGFSSVQTLVVGRDAETSGRSALQSVCSALGRAGLAQPTAPMRYAGTEPRVGLILFQPAGAALADPGRLEDLCMATVEHPVLGCVDPFLEALKTHGEGLRRPHKSRLHAYLTGRDAYVGLKLGEAARAGAWTWSHPYLQNCLDFLRR
ncbi:MAG: hypothetical protein NT029_07615 [Armatimonadetes bacterium]|nr:hypothetical protein [Armatimonadota bacterium]